MKTRLALGSDHERASPQVRSVLRGRLPVRVVASIVLFTVAVSYYAGAQNIDVGRGPVEVYVPASYDPATPTPLVILLHGWGANGAHIDSVWNFTPLAEEYGFLYLHPDGRIRPDAIRFWSATPACCNFKGAPDDDADYLLALIDEMKSQYNVDSLRVYVAGHSNGGFMSHRMACDNSDTIAAIASLAGATFPNPLDCQPTDTVHVLQIHGTNDGSLLFDGGFIYDAPGGEYTSAYETVEQWAAKNGCEIIADTSAPNIDLDGGLAGAESTVTRYINSCDSSGSAELWTIIGGSHNPAFSATYGRQIVEFFYAHPKPTLTPPIPTEGMPLSPWGPVPMVVCLVALGASAIIRNRSREKGG